MKVLIPFEELVILHVKLSISKQRISLLDTVLIKLSENRLNIIFNGYERWKLKYLNFRDSDMSFYLIDLYGIKLSVLMARNRVTILVHGEIF